MNQYLKLASGTAGRVFLFALLASISLIQAQEKPRPKTSTQCAISFGHGQLAMESYCSYFNLSFQEEDHIFYCYKKHKAQCRFVAKKNSIIWKKQPDISTDFYQDKESLIHWLSNIFFNDHGQSLRRLRFASKKLSHTVHPFKDWFSTTASGQSFLRHSAINKTNGIGLSASHAEYYNFINETQPFKEVSLQLPNVFYKPHFWKAFKTSYDQYRQFVIHSPDTHFKKLDSVLAYLKYLISESFGEQPFLFYPIQSRIAESFNGDLNIRLMLYYEQEIAGSMWGKSIVIPFNGNIKNPMILTANFDLDRKNKQNFFYEEYLEDKSANRIHRSTRSNSESCMLCHMQLNKPKMGSFDQLLPETSPYFNDYQDAFYLNNPNAYQAKQSQKARHFKASGQSYFFPQYLQGSNPNHRLELYHYEDLGPFLGDPSSSPKTYACFSKLNRFGQAANCYNCHNKANYGQGPIHRTNFHMAMTTLQEQLYFEADSAFSRKIYKELFMPYNMFIPGTNSPNTLHPQAHSDLKNLMACLNDGFKSDQIDWLSSQLKNAIRELP